MFLKETLSLNGQYLLYLCIQKCNFKLLLYFLGAYFISPSCCCLIMKSCPTLCDPIDQHARLLCPPHLPESKSESHSVMSDSLRPHGLDNGILQARILA